MGCKECSYFPLEAGFFVIFVQCVNHQVLRAKGMEKRSKERGEVWQVSGDKEDVVDNVGFEPTTSRV